MNQKWRGFKPICGENWERFSHVFSEINESIQKCAQRIGMDLNVKHLTKWSGTRIMTIVKKITII